jgi:type IV secretory pathway TraG/TraD family ATPase VirD4
MLIAQSFNQLFAQYGERNSIIDNCKHKAILGTGSPQDAKLVSDSLGSYSINRQTVSQTGTLGNIIARSRSTSFVETERKLMTVDEVLRLPPEDFILIKDGQLPYYGRKLMYYTDRRFLPRVKLVTFRKSYEQQREIPNRALQLDWITDVYLEELKRVFSLPAEKAIAQIAQLPKQKLLTASTSHDSKTSEPSNSAESMPGDHDSNNAAGYPRLDTLLNTETDTEEE